MFTGLDEFADWAAPGDTPSYAAFDRPTGGELSYDMDVAHREGIGGQDSAAYGMIVPTGTLDMLVQTGAFFDTIGVLRTAYPGGLPPEFQVLGGIDGGSPVRHQTGCRINEASFECSVGEALTASLDWLALFEEEDDTAPTGSAALTDKPLEWYYADVLVGTACYETESISINVANNIEPYGTLCAGTTGELRFPSGFRPGAQEVTCSLEIRTWADVDLRVDDPTSTTYDVTAVFAGGTATDSIEITFSLTGLQAMESAIPLESGYGEILWGLELEAFARDDTVLDITVGTVGI